MTQTATGKACPWDVFSIEIYANSSGNGMMSFMIFCAVLEKPDGTHKMRISSLFSLEAKERKLQDSAI